MRYQSWQRGFQFLRIGAAVLFTVVACKGPSGMMSGGDSSENLRTEGRTAEGEAATEPPAATEPGDGQIDNAKVNLEGQGDNVLSPFAGGATGGRKDESVGLALDGGTLTSNKIPTGGFASPTFGAEPWTQKLLLFEEFGTAPLKFPSKTVPFPKPVASTDPSNPELRSPLIRSQPTKLAIDSLINEDGLNPFPMRTANTAAKNPWWSFICGYLGNPRCPALPGPVEGRPPGEDWAHQRWDEFYPQRFMKTTQSGARENLGVRNTKQMHKYQAGEFGPGGLYHNTVGVPGFDGTTKGIKPQFHPKFPVQTMHHLWTFDGTFPLKLLMARYGEPILLRHYNLLPIDVSANAGFGLHTISTHEHNGHNPAESDGFAGAFFFPGQFYDYRWPLAVAGYDSINKDAADPKMATPCVAGETLRVNRNGGTTTVSCDVSKDPARKAGNIRLRGDYREVMSTHWFHDHMIDFTSKNVYKGNAAMMNYYSAIDRGNETLNDGVNLRMPSGSALPWGNRDYDINLAIGDKAWDSTGQLWFNTFDTDGFMGDQVLVNMTWKPVLDVRARRYRFRILNASVARYYQFAIVREVAGTGGSLSGPAGSNVSYELVPFHMIANDGNIMEHSVAFDGTLGTQKGILPTQSIAERYDIVVDFAKHGIAPGSKLYLVNTLEHQDGKRPKDQIPLQSILNGSYKPTVDASNNWTDGDPGVGMVMRFDVKPCVSNGAAVACQDPSMDPALYVESNQNGPNGTPLKMLPRHPVTAQDIANAKHHTYDFVRGGSGGGGTDEKPWAIKVDGGSAITADTRRISAATSLADFDLTGKPKFQIWHIRNSSGGWSHPVHVHFEEGQILSRGGLPPPIWEKWARKDMYRVGPEKDSLDEVVLAMKVREFAGTYVEHCHNTTHEDHAMLLRWDSEKPGQFKLMPTPSPSWYGVNYVASVAPELVRNGDPEEMKVSTLSPGMSVATGQSMAVGAANGGCSFKATMQPDGNFALYRGGSTPLWSTRTAPAAAGGRLSFEGNGDLVLYRANNVPAWRSNTVGRGKEVRLDTSGRLVVRNVAGMVIWASGPQVAGCSAL